MPTHLDTSDAIELAELLQFLNDWLATDRDHIDASLTRFVGNAPTTSTSYAPI
jgi:hypothetical protein